MLESTITSAEALRASLESQIRAICPPEQYGLGKFITHPETRYIAGGESIYMIGEWGHGYDCSTGARRVAHLLREHGLDPKYVMLDQSETQGLFDTDIALQIELSGSNSAMIRTVPFFPMIDTYTKPKHEPFYLPNDRDKETVTLELKPDTSLILGWKTAGQNSVISGAGISRQSVETHLRTVYPGSEHLLRGHKLGPLMIYGTTTFPNKIKRRVNSIVKADTIIPSYVDAYGKVSLGQSASIRVQDCRGTKLAAAEDALRYFPLWEDDQEVVRHLAQGVVDARERNIDQNDFALWMKYFTSV